MKKHVLLLLLALMMVIGLLPMTAQAGTLDNGLVYEIYEGHVFIIDYTGNAAEVVIPAEIEGLPVTGIDYAAFSGCTSLAGIIIPESVTSIGESAFRDCTSLTNITIPDSVAGIGAGAFLNCTSLTSISIPVGVTSIRNHTFYECSSLTSISIPGSVTSIGNSAFGFCSSLTNVSIQFGVISIGEEAFRGCVNLNNIVIPDSVTSIGVSVFSDCANLTSISIPNSVTSIGEGAFCNCTSLSSISIPDGVTSISHSAFRNCSSLTNITIPESVNTLGESAFCGCSNLTRIIIPESVTFLGDSVFADCTSLTSITIPDGVTSIPDYSFYNCESLDTISIPSSITSIGDWSFYHCESLTSISIPVGVTTIGNSAFYDCNSMTTITIPDSVTTIGNYAFQHCASLTSISIPNGVTSVGHHAFFHCFNLSTLYFEGDAPSFSWSIFDGVTATAYYPIKNPTWTKDVMKGYGGNITWIAYDPNHTHAYKAVVTAPTCTEQGFTTYTCSCGDTYVSEDVSALGHDWKGTSCQRCDAKRENPFNDVADGSFYIDPVLWAVENGITNGATPTTFNPNGTCLRAHVVTFLHRAAGNPDPTSSNNPFNDVKSGDFFYQPVLWAVEKGITNGTSATTFGSYANCNRAAVVTFLWRASGSPEPESTNNPFVDVKTTDFFYKPVLWAVENGITNGVDATHFGPATDCNRAQVVTFLYRAYN